MRVHPFDEAVRLSANDGQLRGTTAPGYWNTIGPYGGWTAAVVLAAVLRHPDRLGDPLSLTVHYAGPLAAGDFAVDAAPLRTNRSTQHWRAGVVQHDGDGPVVAVAATVMTAVRRSTWGVSDAPMPDAQAPGLLARGCHAGDIEWARRYDMRYVAGGVPTAWDGAEGRGDTELWVRDDPPRPVDFLSLAAMADCFPPLIWQRRARRVAAGTVTMTTYFHVGAAELAAVGDGHLFAQADAGVFHDGYFDQMGRLWSAAGRLLVTTHQLVYFRQ